MEENQLMEIAQARFPENFKELVSLCKASVELSVNDHKDYYESIEQHLDEEDRRDIDKEVFEQMVKRDTVVRVVAYPLTPIGSFVVYHYDIDKAIDMVLNAIKTTPPTQNNHRQQ